VLNKLLFFSIIVVFFDTFTDHRKSNERQMTTSLVYHVGVNYP